MVFLPDQKEKGKFDENIMLEKQLKIFIGPIENGNIGAMLADAFRKKRIKVTVVSFELSYGHQAGLKYNEILVPPNTSGLNKLQRKLIMFWYYYRNFFRFFLCHNAFIFLFGKTLLPFNQDLPFYRLFGKKTVMWFLGSDIRSYELVEVEIKRRKLKYRQSEARKESPDKIEIKKKMIRKVEKYVDFIIAGPSGAQLLTRNYFGKEMDSRIHIPLNIDNIRYSNVPNSKLVVVHAPSDELRKGTSYVLGVVEQLKREGYDFEFRLLKNMPNTVMKEILTAADIAIDQLFAVGPGMFAVESMAAGCAVLGGNIPEFAGFPRELPIIHTDPDNVYQNLKLLLDSPELRRELGEKGRKYVEKYHDHIKVADKFIKLLTIGRLDEKINE